jgi:hypothetical protein
MTIQPSTDATLPEVFRTPVTVARPLSPIQALFFFAAATEFFHLAYLPTKHVGLRLAIFCYLVSLVQLARLRTDCQRASRLCGILHGGRLGSAFATI